MVDLERDQVTSRGLGEETGSHPYQDLIVMKGEVDRNDDRCLIGRHTDPSDSAVLGRYGQQSHALGRGKDGRTPGIYPHVATMTPIRWWRQGLLTLNNSMDPADRRRREASPSSCCLTRSESWTFGAGGNHLAPREWLRARNLETKAEKEDTSPARCRRGSSQLIVPGADSVGVCAT